MPMGEKSYEQIGVAMTCRSFAEYELMFALAPLSAQDGPILDVAAGASAFVAEASARGVRAYAADPLYAMSPEDVINHAAKEIDTSTHKLAAIRDVYDWSYYRSLDNHRRMREWSLQVFAADFRHNRSSGRYTSAQLPDRPYADDAFSLVLCSHFLFLYQDQFDDEFHEQAVLELLRVCRKGGQVRIYPLRSLKWELYPRLDTLIAKVRETGASAELAASKLPFIPGSSELLLIQK
ncbi:class I SAM-dependent methyltransferase [Paenibacillus xerothermodurans]|nr:class I SAM-dependent methyltransferase [Paenibacillus xerothermodurans]